MQNNLKNNCQNCKIDFLIEEEDLIYYDKIKVPPPTWCSDCRLQRRLAFPNAWSVYFRNCDKCSKKTMSMYRPDAPLTVYCQPCYWADDWDGTEYAMDYDSNRNFLEQWRELQLKTPQCALETTYLNLKNSEYSNAVAYTKNCYQVFWADYCEDVYYSSQLNEIKDSLDLLKSDKSELCYESVGLENSSKVFYSENCTDCVDVWFSRNCYGCINCIGCVNLRGKSYMIFNKQYSKEEYFEKVKEFRLDTREGIKSLLKESKDFWKTLPYREYTGNAQNYNVSGDYIFESKNAKECYVCTGVEDVKFSQFITVPSAKDCMDYSGWGNGASLVYDSGNVGENVSNVKFSYYCFPDVLNTEYSMWCISGKNNFGCANLKRKSYAILNKQYSKEEFEKLRNQIIEDMNKNPYIDKKGRVYKYGEFFPVEFSLFPYNDSNGIRFLPKEKEEAIEEGFNWVDKPELNYTKTINAEDLPQNITETTEDVLKEVIECVDCKKCYKVVDGEFTLYKKLNLPIPDQCPKCRDKRRFDLLNKPKLKDTNCANCKKDIKVMHDLDSGRIIFCEKCYQQEIF
jgi:hypothetical protein